jgi:hypothetical protein
MMTRTDFCTAFISSLILAAVGLVPASGAAQSGETSTSQTQTSADADNDQDSDTANASDESASSESSSPTVSGDRPGFSSSTDTVPGNRFQLEAGLNYSRTIIATTGFNNRSDSASINTFGIDALGRYGLSDAFELRLGVNPISFSSISSQDDGDTTGLGSVSVGAKYTLMRGDTVSFGVLPAIEVGSAFDSASLNAGLTGILDIHLLDPVSTTINATIGGASLVDERSGSSPALTYSAAASFGYGLSDKVGVYAEYYLLGIEGTAPNHHLDGGLTYLLNNQFQLDLYGDYELSGDNTFQLGAGISYLF